jgi:hypothetical protein
MTFSKIKLFGFLALSCSLIACGQTPVSTASNATPNAIAQTTTAPQPAETPAVVAKSPEPQSSVTQVPEKSPEPQSSAVVSTPTETAISQSQDASAKTTVAEQTTSVDFDKDLLYKTLEEVNRHPCTDEKSITEGSTEYKFCTTPLSRSFISPVAASMTDINSKVRIVYFYHNNSVVAAISYAKGQQTFMFDRDGRLQAEIFRTRPEWQGAIKTTSFTKSERDRLEGLARKGGYILSKFR